MDTQTTNSTPYVDEYGIAFKNTPPEVHDFLRGAVFELILKALNEKYRLNTQQQIVVRNIATDMAIGLADIDTATNTLINADINEANTDSILQDMDDEVLARALSQVAFYNGEAEDFGVNAQDTDTPEPIAPTPSDMLSRLNQTLVSPTMLAPTTRDLSDSGVSLDRAGIKNIGSSSEKGESRIDPYRELPEK